MSLICFKIKVSLFSFYDVQAYFYLHRKMQVIGLLFLHPSLFENFYYIKKNMQKYHH
jgi:hypothetical protein